MRSSTFLATILLTSTMLLPSSSAVSTSRLVPVASAQVRYAPLSQDVVIKTSDSAITTADVRDVSTILQHYSIPILSENLSPSMDKPLVIKLFGTQADFRNALKKYFPAAYHKNPIVTVNGFAVDTTVFLPMYEYKSGTHTYHNPDLSNYLTHELTHAMINAMHISVPTWVNEGFAWYNGMEAETKYSSPFSSVLANESYYSFVKAADHGVLLPLKQTESDIMNNSYYNVEFEDYLAVSELIVSDGFPTFREFLSLSQHQDFATAYQMTYHSTIGQYENFFYDYNEPHPAP